MDISIAVSLIRGQMGTVVEQAVNGAVETVLAEMLKVVGVKFEELKSQVAQMKRDIAVLQREKSLKEKENDNIRSKLRYTELKLKYYRQGVEEELQQRASASNLVRIHPPTYIQTQRGGAGVSSTETSPSCSTQVRASEGSLTRNNQEFTSPHTKRRRNVRVHSQSDVASSEPSDPLLPALLPVNTGAECVDSSTVLFGAIEQDPTQSQDDDQEECEWAITVEPQAEAMDAGIIDASHSQTLNQDSEKLSGEGSLSPDGSTQADSSTLPSAATQMKHEPQQQKEQDVICIKEEPEEEQEVTAALLLDCQLHQSLPPESEAKPPVAEWSEHQENQRNPPAAFSTAGTSSYVMPQPAASLPSVASLQPINPSHQVDPTWTNDLTLYEEYKLRRNELRRINQSRRRELEKMLPQPLLADLVRERREKTRLRVARWRAKRKLQAGLNQIQAEGGAVGVSQTGFPINNQEQQLRASSSSGQQRQTSSLPQPGSFLNNMSNTLPFIPSTSSSSSLHPNSSSMTLHQQTVTSSSSSSSYPQASFSQQEMSLLDSDIIQCRI
ncbi:uncharacterized protein si:ch211-67e16.4 [Cheilinus undulatus]|uniref:uncharacterized protein si:ch211-67e16.4 n=1 Tax=Cheilinus undulatus TaxID=241271 RepID=UPI001BD3901C|nr:uncharacterized protein si:ch211-67e16.4 [Cheilinus undulatus]